MIFGFNGGGKTLKIPQFFLPLSRIISEACSGEQELKAEHIGAMENGLELDRCSVRILRESSLNRLGNINKNKKT